MDKTARERFRERLVGAEAVTPALRERYEREVQMLFEKKLTPLSKWGMMAMVGMQAAIAVFFGYSFFVSSELPFLARAGFAAGVLFALSFGVVLIRIIRRGSMNIRTDPSLMTGLVWGFMIIMITFFMLLAGSMKDQVRGIALVLNGLVFFNIFGVVGMLQNNIQQSQLKTQEKLLEIELHIVELREAIEKK